MSLHQGIKAEIDARENNFEECNKLGQLLVQNGHYASEEIKIKLDELSKKRNEVVDRWQEKWDYLNLCED